METPTPDNTQNTLLKRLGIQTNSINPLESDIPLAITSLSSEDIDTKLNAIFAVSNEYLHIPVEIQPVIIAQLCTLTLPEEQNVFVRIAAIKALGRIYNYAETQDELEQREAVTSFLLKSITTDEEKDVRVAAARSLHISPTPFLPELIHATKRSYMGSPCCYNKNDGSS